MFDERIEENDESRGTLVFYFFIIGLVLLMQRNLSINWNCPLLEFKNGNFLFFFKMQTLNNSSAYILFVTMFSVGDDQGLADAIAFNIFTKMIYFTKKYSLTNDRPNGRNVFGRTLFSFQLSQRISA